MTSSSESRVEPRGSGDHKIVSLSVERRGDHGVTHRQGVSTFV